MNGEITSEKRVQGCFLADGCPRGEKIQTKEGGQEKESGKGQELLSADL